LLCFAGGLHLAAEQVVIEAELDSGLAARRLRREIGELYGQPAGSGRCQPPVGMPVPGIWCGWNVTVRCWPAAPV